MKTFFLFLIELMSSDLVKHLFLLNFNTSSGGWKVWGLTSSSALLTTDSSLLLYFSEEAGQSELYNTQATGPLCSSQKSVKVILKLQPANVKVNGGAAQREGPTGGGCDLKKYKNVSQCKPSSARSMNGGAADDCPLQQLGKLVREYADIQRGTRLKKNKPKTKTTQNPKTRAHGFRRVRDDV